MPEKLPTAIDGLTMNELQRMEALRRLISEVHSADQLPPDFYTIAKELLPEQTIDIKGQHYRVIEVNRDGSLTVDVYDQGHVTMEHVLLRWPDFKDFDLA